MKPILVRLSVTIGGAILLVLTAVGCAAPGNPPGQIELSVTEFDFGTVANTAPVSEVFQVGNVGQGFLEITGVSTSCGCTTAETGNQQLEPGESTPLTVMYDPQVHKGETGNFLRVVYVRSNDPDTAEASLTIRVTVVAQEDL